MVEGAQADVRLVTRVTDGVTLPDDEGLRLRDGRGENPPSAVEKSQAEAALPFCQRVSL